MRSLGSLLEKFSHLTPPEGLVRDSVIALTRELCGVTLSVDEIRFRNGVITLTTHPTRKSEILLRKDALLSAIREKTVLGQVRDIR